MNYIEDNYFNVNKFICTFWYFVVEVFARVDRNIVKSVKEWVMNWTLFF